MEVLKDYFDAFVHLIYPSLCICCRRDLPIKGNYFCLDCLSELSFTSHFEDPLNEFVDKFYGRVPIQFGGALINYHSGHRVKNMLHALKYQRQKVIGIELGRILGKQLKECEIFEKPAFVIPVPLHPKKKIKRGYNQAEVIGRAIAEVLEIEMRTDILIKTTSGTSQTKKSRIERATDVMETIKLRKKKNLVGAHVLVVDDVMTTGATLEACALRLSEIEGFSFSFVTLAMTKMR